MSGLSDFFSGKTFKLVAAVAGVIIVVGVVGYGAYWLYNSQKTAGQIPDVGTIITFVQAGVTERFAINQQGVLVRVVQRPRETNIVAYEEAASPFSDTDRVVLAKVPLINGTVLGILDLKDNVKVLVSGNNNKSDLVVRPDGIAVFSAQKLLPQYQLTTAPASPGAEDVNIEKGHADGPVDTGVSFAAESKENDAQLYGVNIKTGEIRPLGAGKSPRLLPDGNVIAISNDGVVLVDPATGTRTMLLAWPGADGVLSGISPSGNIIAVAGSDGQSSRFYKLTRDSSYKLTAFGGMDKETVAASLAFVDDARFFVRESYSSARLFAVPTSALPIAVPEALITVNPAAPAPAK